MNAFYYDELRLRSLGCVRFIILIAAKYKLFAFFRKVISMTCIKPTYQTQSVPVNRVSRACIFNRNASPLLGRSLSTGLSNKPFFSY